MQKHNWPLGAIPLTYPRFKHQQLLTVALERRPLMPNKHQTAQTLALYFNNKKLEVECIEKFDKWKRKRERLLLLSLFLSLFGAVAHTPFTGCQVPCVPVMCWSFPINGGCQHFGGPNLLDVSSCLCASRGCGCLLSVCKCASPARWHDCGLLCSNEASAQEYILGFVVRRISEMWQYYQMHCTAGKQPTRHNINIIL